MRFKKLVVAGISACVLGGCGGGGGGGGGTVSSTSSPTITASYSPSSVSANYPSGASSSPNQPGVTVTATFSGLPAGFFLAASGLAYVYVVTDGAIFTGGPQLLNPNTDGTANFFLPINTSLAAGTYSGALNLKVCLDRSCSSFYQMNGGTLTYTVTLTP